MVQECKKDGRLTVWGSGSRKMQYVHLPDVVKCTIRALSIEAGTFNLGGDEYETVADTAAAIARFFGADLEFLRDKKEGMTLPFMDNQKLKTATGADLYTPFSQALEHYLEGFEAS